LLCGKSDPLGQETGLRHAITARRWPPTRRSTVWN
jgi:hypothetical protein